MGGSPRSSGDTPHKTGVRKFDTFNHQHREQIQFHLTMNSNIHIVGAESVNDRNLPGDSGGTADDCLILSNSKTG